VSIAQTSIQYSTHAGLINAKLIRTEDRHSCCCDQGRRTRVGACDRRAQASHVKVSGTLERCMHEVYCTYCIDGRACRCLQSCAVDHAVSPHSVDKRSEYWLARNNHGVQPASGRHSTAHEIRQSTIVARKSGGFEVKFGTCRPTVMLIL